MDANKILAANSSNNRRIRKISRILKTMLLVYIIVVPMVLNAHLGKATWTIAGQSYHSFSEIPAAQKLLAALTMGSYLLIAITFYRLLNLYEKGIIFAVQNARLLRVLGDLLFANGLIGVVAPVVAAGPISIPSLLIAIIGSPWVIGGLFGIMISLIMEEGCKMQAEQALTV